MTLKLQFTVLTPQVVVNRATNVMDYTLRVLSAAVQLELCGRSRDPHAMQHLA